MTAALLDKPIAEDTSASPGLRLLPAPASEPPFDDEPGARPVLKLVATAPVVTKPEPWDQDTWLASERTPSSLLPPPAGFARVLVQALLEVRAGVRPLQQLRRDTTQEVYSSLRLTLAARGQQDRGSTRCLIRSLHVQQRAEGVAEVCATVRQGTRFSAFALRLEGMDGRWRCTELSGV
jgi:hypothetical protein